MAVAAAESGPAGQPERGELMLHPVVVLAVGLLLLNDHVLKGAFPGVITGKLSDFAGLAFFPVLLSSVAELAWQQRLPNLRLAVVTAVLTGVVFAATNLFTVAGDAYAWALGAVHTGVGALTAAVTKAPAPPLVPVTHTVDPTDLVALPALLLGPWLHRRRRPTPLVASGDTGPAHR